MFYWHSKNTKNIFIFFEKQILLIFIMDKKVIGLIQMIISKKEVANILCGDKCGPK